ncbi:MAG: hypothetical protein PWP31_386 [Clostridia bacterium]|nr:hypothetical protein [Clostridia bacterium]
MDKIELEKNLKKKLLKRQLNILKLNIKKSTTHLPQVTVFRMPDVSLMKRKFQHL